MTKLRYRTMSRAFAQWALLAVGATLMVQVTVTAADRILVSDGKATGCIVTAQSPDERVLAAVNNLRGYIQEMSGAQVPRRTDADECEGFRIFVGSTRLAPVDPAWVTEDKIGKDTSIAPTTFFTGKMSI